MAGQGGGTTSATYPTDQSTTTPGFLTIATVTPAVQKLIDKTVFIINDPISNVQAKTAPLNQPDNVLFYSRSLTGSFNLPADQAGSINSNVMWAVYFDKNLWQPIQGVKYPAYHYDPIAKTLDVVFWANVNYKDINVKGKEDLYDSVRPALQANGDIDPNSQRVVFYTQGSYRAMVCDRTGEMKITGMFIFTKPVLLLNPGPKNGDLADAVTDEMPQYGFIEYQG